MSEKRPDDLYVLDLDRTLFRTADFTEDMLQTLQDQADLASHHVDDIQEAMSQPVSLDIAAELEKVGVPFEALEELVQQLPESYVYDDISVVRSLYKAMIITTGTNEAMQRLKIQLSGVATEIPSHVVTGNKGEFLKHELKQDTDGRLWLPEYGEDERFDRVVLVDDNYGVIESVIDDPRIVPIYVQRADAKYHRSADQIDPRVKVIESLHELSDITDMAA